MVPTKLHAAAVDLADLLARGTQDGIAILDPTHHLVLWNSAAAAITGWTEKEAAARGFGNILKLPEGLRELRHGKWVELRRSPLRVGDDTYTVVFFTDSTAERRLRDTHEELRDLGVIDAATQLPGRQLALLHLQRALALGKRDRRAVGLLNLKLDRYREPNGPSGRHVADEVIRQFAKRLAAFVRTSDMPARLAEDSFLVVLTALSSSDDAKIVAVRLLLALAQPFDVEGRERSVQCSIGIAEYPRDADEAIGLLGTALAAADRAQRLGGGRYCSAAETVAEG